MEEGHRLNWEVWRHGYSFPGTLSQIQIFSILFVTEIFQSSSIRKSALRSSILAKCPTMVVITMSRATLHIEIANWGLGLMID